MGMFVLLVPALLGTEVARRMAFPLGFLFFAVPFGDFLTPWLMDRTADFTVLALRATGIPVFREGLEFVIPSGSWSVVQACSGIRYLMASVMVGTLFAYLNYRSHTRRWVFVGVAVVTPLLANWLRAYLIVMLGHLSGNTLAVGVDHLIYGWVFFGIIMLAMFMMGARWAEPDAAPEAVAAGTSAALGAQPPRWLAAMALTVLLLALPLALRMHADERSAHGEPELAAPQLQGWAWRAEPLASWRPAFANAAATLHGRYEPERGGDAIGVYIGYYRDQRPGRQLVTSINGLVDGESDHNWSRTALARASLDAKDSPLDWRVTELRGQALSHVSGGGSLAPRLRVWQVYWINGRPFTSDWQAKLYGVWRKLQGGGDDAAVLLVYADKDGAGPDDTRLRAFLSAHWRTFDTALSEVRDRGAMR
jgi:EpsI family protein